MAKIIEGIDLSNVSVSCDYTNLSSQQTALKTVADLVGGYIKEFGDGTNFTVKFYDTDNEEISTISASGTVLPDYAGMVIKIYDDALSYEYLERAIHQKLYVVTEDLGKVDVDEVKKEYDSDLDGVLDASALPDATTSQKGALSASDKTKLNNLNTNLANKVDKVSGKGLSTNDYTTSEKSKLAGIETGAQVNKVTGIKGSAESSYRIGNVNLTPSNIGAATSNHTHSVATTSAAGFMSAADKTKLNTAATNAQNAIDGVNQIAYYMRLITEFDKNMNVPNTSSGTHSAGEEFTCTFDFSNDINWGQYAFVGVGRIYFNGNIAISGWEWDYSISKLYVYGIAVDTFSGLRRCLATIQAIPMFIGHE